jgi:uncharacterized GH25 family protein
MKEKPGRRDKEMDRIEKEHLKQLARMQVEHEKVARNVGKESKGDHKHREKDDKEIKASKKGLWVMVRNLDETRADEVEEERRKADSPFGLVPLLSLSS